MNPFKLFLSIVAVLCLGNWAQHGNASIHVVNFNYADYRSGLQNWGLALDGNRALYCGNVDGLLRFNGSDWQLLRDEGTGTIRSVLIKDSRIYAVGDNSVGYWQCNKSGKMSYTSLHAHLDSLGVSGDTFWSVQSVGNEVLIQSFGCILRYDGVRMTSVVKGDIYSLLHKTDGEIYAKHDNAIYRYVDGKMVEMFRGRLPKGADLRFFYKVGNQEYIIGLSNGMIFKLTNDRLVLMITLTDDNGYPITIDCGDIYDNRLIAIGTLSKGLYMFNLHDGKLNHITTSKLQDRNVHDVIFADGNHLWLSMDNGISALIFNPRIALWKGNEEIGSFLDACSLGDNLFVATNQGLFKEQNEVIERINLLPLSVYADDNVLMCGTMGPMLASQNNSMFAKLCDDNGIERIEYTISHDGKEWLMCAGYSGITVLKREDGKWKHHSLLNGTSYYSFIQPEGNSLIWAVHAANGVYRFRMDEKKCNVEQTEHFEDIDGCKDFEHIIPVRIDGMVLLFSPKGIYRYDADEKKMIRQRQLSDDVEKIEYLQAAGSIGMNRIYVATAGEIRIYHIIDMHAKEVNRLSFVHSGFNVYNNRINIKAVSDSLLFIPTHEGTYIWNLNRERDNRERGLYIEQITYNDGQTIHYATCEEGLVKLPYSAAHINISVTSGLSTSVSNISYRLHPLSDEWSQWQKGGIVSLATLTDGNYILEVKDSQGNMLAFEIEVLPPFYKRWWMIAFYVFVIVGITVFTVLRIARKKRQEMTQHLQEEHRMIEEEMQRKAYKQLQEKAKAQEEELKNRLRYLTQKQELLNNIAGEVEAQKSELGDRYPNKLYKRLMTIIQAGESDKDHFLSFENYFVEVHYDFMLHFAKLYPQLTMGELKFACLIRAGLSVKEISSILGIEVRSVELKRYRLKQKMKLDTNTSLSTVIINT